MSNRERGFTLVEIMVVVAIIGVLAATAIPIFASHMRRAKTSEAQLQLNAIAKGAKAYYQIHTKFPQGTAGVLPAADGGACGAAGGRMAVTNAWTADDRWNDLDFHMDEPALFSYHYESTSQTEAVAFAVGDLDCDKKLITYRLELTAPAGGVAAKLIEPSPSED